MGWVLVAIGAVLAIGGALRALIIGGRAVSQHPDPSDPERNAPRYVKPAMRAALASMAGMVLIIVGGVTLVAELIAAAFR